MRSFEHAIWEREVEEMIQAMSEMLEEGYESGPPVIAPNKVVDDPDEEEFYEEFWTRDRIRNFWHV